MDDHSHLVRAKSDKPDTLLNSDNVPGDGEALLKRMKYIS